MVAEPLTTELVTAAMSTTVSVQIVGAVADARQRAADALAWFAEVERCCSRFLPDSEVTALCSDAGGPRAVSPLLFEILRVALAAAAASDGAFDPTLGRTLHGMGFDRAWQRDERVALPAASAAHAKGAAGGGWRQIVLDKVQRTIELPPFTLLDLGAIAKGFALDLAAQALDDVNDFCLVAGGDLRCRGHNARGVPWRTAVRHPFAPHGAACVVEVHAHDYALCTSGSDRRATAAGHHLLDPRAPRPAPATALRSVTVVAPQAAIADALATAAFVLGATDGAALLLAQQVDGYFVDSAGMHHEVHGWKRATFTRSDSAVA